MERTLEIPGPTVDVHVERVEGGASLAQCGVHDVPNMTQEIADRGHGQRIRPATAMETGPPECLVRIDIAHPGDESLV
jgi:hypothetical protein